MLCIQQQQLWASFQVFSTFLSTWPLVLCHKLSSWIHQLQIYSTIRCKCSKVRLLSAIQPPKIGWILKLMATNNHSQLPWKRIPHRQEKGTHSLWRWPCVYARPFMLVWVTHKWFGSLQEGLQIHTAVPGRLTASVCLTHKHHYSWLHGWAQPAAKLSSSSLLLSLSNALLQLLLADQCTIQWQHVVWQCVELGLENPGFIWSGIVLW